MKNTTTQFLAIGSAIVISALSICARAETKTDAAGDQTDTKIVALLQAIMKGLTARDNGDYDEKALAKANDAMLTYMKEAMTNPALLTAKLKQATDAGLTVASSADNKVRFYSWDTQTGGTMHFFDNIVQYQLDPTDAKTEELVLCPSGRQKVSDGDIESGYIYSSVQQMNTSDGRKIYFALATGVYGSIDHSAVIQAFEIKNKTLKKVAVFKTKTELLDEISCGFHDASDEITLDEKAKKLFIPLVKEGGAATGRYLVYIFNGRQFVYKGVEGRSKTDKN
ncbi:MAG TPA: hypothetical protein V6C69_11780 [Trichormus sp.]